MKKCVIFVAKVDWFFGCGFFLVVAQGGLEPSEGLMEAAIRELHEELGPNMDIWSIGRVPAAYYTYPALPSKLSNSELKGTKVSFFYSAGSL